MGYAKIPNLYKVQDILMFRECYAMEKIHGTSAHIQFIAGVVRYGSGGAGLALFKGLFDTELLEETFSKLANLETRLTIYGEAYGGKLQRMSETYGPDLRFVAFDVKLNDQWLSVPHAENVARQYQLDFVHYKKVSTDLATLDAERDAESIQAVRNGMGHGRLREGVVLRPLSPVYDQHMGRICAKHKGELFQERAHQPKVKSADELVILRDANAIAEEWVVPMRLDHVLQKLRHAKAIEHTGEVIEAVLADVLEEAAGEVVVTRAVEKAIKSRAAKLWKSLLQSKSSNGDS